MSYIKQIKNSAHKIAEPKLRDQQKYTLVHLNCEFAFWLSKPRSKRVMPKCQMHVSFWRSANLDFEKRARRERCAAATVCGCTRCPSKQPHQLHRSSSTLFVLPILPLSLAQTPPPHPLRSGPIVLALHTHTHTHHFSSFPSLILAVEEKLLLETDTRTCPTRYPLCHSSRPNRNPCLDNHKTSTVLHHNLLLCRTSRLQAIVSCPNLVLQTFRAATGMPTPRSRRNPSTQ